MSSPKYIKSEGVWLRCPTPGNPGTWYFVKFNNMTNKTCNVGHLQLALRTFNTQLPVLKFHSGVFLPVYPEMLPVANLRYVKERIDSTGTMAVFEAAEPSEEGSFIALIL